MVAQRDFVLEFPGVGVHMFVVDLFMLGNNVKRIADVNVDFLVLGRVVDAVFSSKQDASL